MMKQAMTLAAGAILFALPIVAELSAQDGKPLAQFNGGIAVDPLASFAQPGAQPNTFELVTRNIVRGVRSGLTPWRIADLKAQVDGDGRVRVLGKGLLVAAGDGIGTNLNQKVFATLICEAQAPFVERNTASSANGTAFEGAVPLEPNGDFFIDGQLKLIGDGPDPVPADCASPVLLIRTASGAWLAAGIPVLGK